MRTKFERLDVVHVPIGFAGHILSLPSTKHCGDPLSVINLRKRLSAAGVLRSRLGGVGSPSCHVTKLACTRPTDRAGVAGAAAVSYRANAYHFAYHLGVTGRTLQYAPVTGNLGKVTPRTSQKRLSSP
jgi:hypothetical protein